MRGREAICLNFCQHKSTALCYMLLYLREMRRRVLLLTFKNWANCSNQVNVQYNRINCFLLKCLQCFLWNEKEWKLPIMVLGEMKLVQIIVHYWTKEQRERHPMEAVSHLLNSQLRVVPYHLWFLLRASHHYLLIRGSFRPWGSV